MKKGFLLTCLLLFISVLIKNSYAVTLTIKMDRNGTPHLLRDEVEVRSGDRDLIIRKAEVIRLALINNSGKNIRISIKQPGGKQILLDTTVFKIINPISTDENLNLIIRNQSISLDKQFSLFFSTDPPSPENELLNVNFEIIRMQESQSTLAASPDVSTKSELLSTPLKKDTEKMERVYQPGSFVFDAFKLSDEDHLSLDELKKITKYYYPDLRIETLDDIRTAVAQNPFLRDIINSGFQPQKKSLATAESAAEILSILSLSSAGGLDVTTIADGLAKFLVKRTKQELTGAFFDRFKKILDDPKYTDLKTIFPATYEVLSAMGNDIYDYNQYFQNLREAFKTDISNLNENLPGVIPNHHDYFITHHVLAASLNSSCYIAGNLQDQVHPGDIIDNFPINYLNDESNNWTGSVQTLQLLNASLRNVDATDSDYWVNLNSIRELVNDKRAFKIYLGLLYQNAIQDYDSIHFVSATLIQIMDSLARHTDYYDSFKTYVLGFAVKTEAVSKMIKTYSKPATDSIATELYAKYFKASVDLVEYSSEAGSLPFINKAPFLSSLHDTLAVYFDLANSTADLVTDINRRNYSSAINQLVHIYNVIINSPLDEKVAGLKKKIISNREYNHLQKKYLSDSTLLAAARGKTEITYQNYEALKKDTASFHNLKNIYRSSEANSNYLSALSDSIRQSSEMLTKLIKYGSLMASVATAKNSDEVENAIESAALPAGSSRIKRESAFNVSLNGYVGLYAGYEKIKDVDEPYQFNLKNQWNTFGLTAPVGIAAGIGSRKFFWLGNEEKRHWSYSLLISAVDLGAVAAFRFSDNDTVAQVPTIQLKDLISPGAFLSIGIPKSPVSVNLGAQAGPNLRKMNINPGDNGSVFNDYSNKMYWRYSVSVCVDIPILNFYTKQRQ